MPLPTYAFEWGASQGAAVPTSSNIESLALGLVNITKERAAWFRTLNVLIPWGCDYNYRMQHWCITPRTGSSMSSTPTRSGESQPSTARPVSTSRRYNMQTWRCRSRRISKRSFRTTAGQVTSPRDRSSRGYRSRHTVHSTLQRACSRSAASEASRRGSGCGTCWRLLAGMRVWSSITMRSPARHAARRRAAQA
jgi:hypothetical protein